MEKLEAKNENYKLIEHGGSLVHWATFFFINWLNMRD